jgi:tetratricopeptide (TPR) repeat protein
MVRRKKQIKILAVTASPEGSKDIRYEKEQETLLDAFCTFETTELYLDMPDPVGSTLAEVKSRLRAGKHDVLLIAAHVSLDGRGRGVLAFEDEQGMPVEVPAKKFAGEVSAAAPVVVVLTCSHSAARQLHFPAVARTLHSAGIRAVIAMKQPLSPQAAKDFFNALFSALVDRKNVEDAFEAGKQAIETGEQETPKLYVTGEPVTINDFSGHVIETCPLETLAQIIPDSGSLHGKTGFIGRRDVLRRVFKDIEAGAAAIVLKGAEGVGKSAVVLRIAAQLKQKKFTVIVFHGVSSPEMVLKRIAQTASQKGVKGANAVFESRIEYREKLEKLLDPFILKKKLLLVFEDFDDNLDTDGEFLNGRLKELVTFFNESLQDRQSAMLFSTRSDIPKFDSIELATFSWLEFRKQVFKTNRLKRLDEISLKYFYFEMGGYPRAVQYFDGIALYEFAGGNFLWADLRNRVAGLTERLLHKESESADFSSLAAETLLGLIDQRLHRQLAVLSVYRRWVPGGALAEHELEIDAKDRYVLSGLFQVQYSGKGSEPGWSVPRLISRIMWGRVREDELKQAHLIAAGYFDTGAYDEHHLEARRHYIEAGEIDRAANMTFDMDAYFCSIGFLQFAFDLVCELEAHVREMSEANQLRLHNRLAMMYSLFGKLDEAIGQHQSALELNEAQGNSAAAAVNLGQLAVLYEAKGKDDEALDYFERCLKVVEQLGDRSTAAQRMEQIGSLHKRRGDYDKAYSRYRGALDINRELDNQKSISIDLEQLGRIFDEQGKFDEALDYYNQSIQLRETLDDRTGIAALQHQVGNVYFVKGDPDSAYDYYQKALALNEELGDRRAAGYSRGQIGLILQRRGNIDAALVQYKKSMEDFEAADEQKGMAAGHHQLGRIYQDKGDRDNALTHYKKAMELREKSGDLLGAAITYGQLGLLYYEKEEYETALRHSVQAYAVFSRYGSPNVELARQNMLRIRARIPEDTFNQILEEYNIKTGKNSPDGDRETDDRQVSGT